MITDLESDPHPLHHTPGLLERSSDTFGCLRFTFVRHPFDRLVSFYLQAIRRADQDRHPIDPTRLRRLSGELEKSGLSLGMSFEEFLNVVVQTPESEQNPHVKSQVGYLFTWRGLAVDFLGRVENFQKDISFITGYAGCLGGLPPVLNKSTNPGWRNFDALTPAARRTLAVHYDEDLRFLGYDS